MSPEELNTLRKEVKHTMINLGLDREGSYDKMLPPLNRILDFPISKSTLSMSLTGYRSGQRHQKVLEALQRLLAVWTPDPEN